MTCPWLMALGLGAALLAAGPFSASHASGARADGPQGALGRLDWGADEQGSPWTARSLREHIAASPDDDLSRQIARLFQVAEEPLGTEIHPVAHLHIEGRLSSDPSYQESAAATAQLDTVYAWATCARLADPPLADQCQSAAADAVAAWVTTYEPSGDPIDENRLIPLLQSIDLLLPLLPAPQRAQALGWTAQLGERGEALFDDMPPESSRRVNNWESWHLAIQGMVALLTADPDLTRRTRVAAHEQIARNVAADGATYDFHQRDALHYQVYDLEALVDLDLFTGLVNADDETAILNGLQFLTPYVVGDEQHVEFADSLVAFDRARRDAGDPIFANAPWDPASGRSLLRLARSHFPSVRDWSASVADERYAPRLKELAALFALPTPDAAATSAPQS